MDMRMETQQENNQKKRKDKKRKKKKQLSLFHNAAVVMSLLSWYTTFGGFKNTVFAEGQELTAALASMAIQLILLGGVLNLIPVLKFICKNNYIIFLRIFMVLIVISTFFLSMIASIMFSYISIANTIYQTDFAVNANIKMDKFMRSTIQDMETDSENYLDKQQKDVIQQIKENGEDIIKKSAFKRAKEYAATNSTILELVEIEELISLDKKIDEEYDLLKNEDDVKYKYKFIRKDYVDRLHKNLINSQNLGNSQFSAGLKNKINNINRDKYAMYGEYHYQYTFAVNCYNKWIVRLRGGKKAKQLNLKKFTKDNMPTLEKMESLYDFCVTIKGGLKELLEAIDNIADGKAPENTKRLISEAKMNMDSLILETDDLSEKVKNLIENSYGENAYSFEELISAFGSSETETDDLNQARKQLLKMQGALLSDNANIVGGVTNLIHNIERYIYAVEYAKDLDSLKTKVNQNYNIVKSVVESGDKRNGFSQADPDSATGSAASSTGSGIEEDRRLNVVIDVTPDDWTEIKKSQMTELEGLIYGHPLNIYPDEEDDSTDDNKSEGVKANRYTTDEGETNEGDSNYISQAELYRKSFLDTSDMEKAYNLFWGDESLFEYKGKAVLALIFAVFLDFGAFLIGLVMYFSRSRRGRRGN